MSASMSPPATIAMIGGGQLGRYAILAARQMGFRTMVLDPSPDAPAGPIADVHLVADYDDPSAIARIGSEADVVTIEFENPPASVLDHLAGSLRVAPSSRAVEVAQDRITEKRFLADAGCPVGRWAPIESADDIAQAAAQIDGPAILKTARMGYDGKGQVRVSSTEELAAAWSGLGEVRCVLEAEHHLVTEVSVVLARSAVGEHAVYPLAQNHHRDGILDVSVVPAQVSDAICTRAREVAVTIADALDYVGVLAVEFFIVTADGDDGDDSDDIDLLVNEIAPRPHNSGHWTLDASATSQFEQQIRAICGLPLGDPSLTRPGVAMANLLGDVWHDDEGKIREPNWADVLDARTALHLYGKPAARHGRKMGHLTSWGPREQVEAHVRTRRDRA